MHNPKTKKKQKKMPQPFLKKSKTEVKLPPSVRENVVRAIQEMITDTNTPLAALTRCYGFLNEQKILCQTAADHGLPVCKCTPPDIATERQVQKEGPSQGRWFYTCQKTKEQGGCGFFAWTGNPNPTQYEEPQNTLPDDSEN